MANAIPWPHQLRPTSSSWRPDAPSRSGGQSVTGAEQVVVSPGGRWQASLSVALQREPAILAYRALLAQLQGRAGTVLVPVSQAYRPRDVNGRMLSPVRVAGCSDAQLFDLTALAQSDPVHATLAASAAMGATQISVTLVDGEGPQPGHYFGIGNRLYLIQTAWRATVEAPMQIRFWPRLRAAAAAGERVILDRPVCLMRLAADDSGASEFDLGRFGGATFEFVEAL